MAERAARWAPFLVSPIRSVRFRLLAIALLPTLVLLPLFPRCDHRALEREV